jgi:vanillate O-demethylase ferredoxin subunit
MRSTKHWTEAIVASYCDITPTVREFMIRPCSPVLRHDPGSHLPFQLLLDGKHQTRTYSLVGEPDASTYRVAVKRQSDGRGGSLAMWRLHVGDRLRIGEPQNFFPLDLTAPAYLLVAGGIGVTPLVRMAQTLARRQAPVRMLQSARDEGELAYAALLGQTLGDQYQTFVSSDKQRLHFPTEIAALPLGAQLIVCGPAAMREAASQAWTAANRPCADLRFETFGSSGHLASQAFQVELPRQQLGLTVPAEVSLLEALEAAGVQVLSNCRRGECGLCAMDILSLDGEIDHRDVFLSDAEKRLGKRICACVSRVNGSVKLDAAYRTDAARTV